MLLPILHTLIYTYIHIYIHTFICVFLQTKGVGSEAEIKDLVEFYKSAKKLFDEDPDFQSGSRKEVVQLQSGDEQSVAAWKLICAKSRQEFDQVYSMLGVVGLQERGESFYNPMLSDVVAGLQSQGLAVDSEGASCVVCYIYSYIILPLPL